MADRNINTIVKAVAELTAVSVGAQTYDGMPSVEPDSVPAVYSEWLYSEPNSDAYGVKNSKALNRSAKHRVHFGKLTVLLAATSDAAYATENSRQAAQKIMDAFDLDSTLEDTDGVKVADMVTLTRVEPDAWQIGQTIYIGVSADWQAMEMI